LQEEQWAVAFQSRFGRAEWLQPYTSELLAAWAQSWVKSVDVICPGFAADCLETLEEIALENRQVFLDSRRQTLSLYPGPERCSNPHRHADPTDRPPRGRLAGIRSRP
jgi:ferrochelatase